MNRRDLDTIADRLAALEALEAAPPGPLTAIDADALDDDEVLDEVLYGLSGDGHELTIGERGIYQVTFSNPEWGPSYWHRIAERARAVCLSRGVILFPLESADVTEALRLIDAGVLEAIAQPAQTRYSHESCIRPIFWPQIGWTEYYRLRARLAHALDSALWQRRMLGEHSELTRTTDELRALLAASQASGAGAAGGTIYD